MEKAVVTLFQPGSSLKVSLGPSVQEEEIDSRKLLGIDGKVFIMHQGERYCLRQTKLGKLILTK